MFTTRQIAFDFADDAATARENGMWYNSRIIPGGTYGPFSGDSMTAQIAFGASINAVAIAAGRPALEIAAHALGTVRVLVETPKTPTKKVLTLCYCDSAYHAKGC